jgi:hypothetical protein
MRALRANPKQFPKKKGRLAGVRAAPLKFESVAYRAVFTLDEAARAVFVLALDSHDREYRQAARRKKPPKPQSGDDLFARMMRNKGWMARRRSASLRGAAVSASRGSTTRSTLKPASRTASKIACSER